MTDVVVNPKTLIVDGVAVSSTNPIPIAFVSGVPTDNTAVVLNPSTPIVEGNPVSATNILPLQVV